MHSASGCESHGVCSRPDWNVLEGGSREIFEFLGVGSIHVIRKVRGFNPILFSVSKLLLSNVFLTFAVRCFLTAGRAV